MPWSPDYVTDQELRDFLRIPDAVDDTFISIAKTAASRAVDRHTNRQFGVVAAPQARRYTAHWDAYRRRWVIDIDDLQTAVGLVLTTEAGTIDVFTLQPVNADETGDPWTRIVVEPESAVHPTSEEDGVTITASWGWTAVPVAVKQATLIQAARFFTRRGAPFGIAGSPEQGSEMRLLSKVDADVAVILGRYQRWWAAA
jgi:hypothetical protein